MSSDSPEPTIHVDEDWKAQVEAEKEELASGGKAASDTDSADSPAAHAGTNVEPPPSASSDENDPVMPPPTFAMLISSLGTQAVISLGQIPDPLSGQPQTRPNLAKYLIDTLAMLEKKTQGNLDQAETRMLDDLLHRLRMLYVGVKK